MGGKTLAFLLMILVVTSSAIFVYQNLPKDPVEMKIEELILGRRESYVDYGKTPVFQENLRFSTNNISYHIDISCPKDRKEKMIQAFDLFQEEMGIISFYEGSSSSDILVGCSNDFIELGENLFAAGEGGPSEIINATVFKTIKKGKIILYQESRCDYPVVEIHELCHVFGFDHSENEKSIIYPSYRCDQRITPDMVEIINELYSIEPLPDLVITELVAVKKGKYLDFNITVLNEGYTTANNVSLGVFVDEELIQDNYFGEIAVGFGRTLNSQNVKMPSIKDIEVKFFVDFNGLVRELEEENNIARAYV